MLIYFCTILPELCTSNIRNATKYNDINEDIHQQAVKILKLFESIFEDFRLQQLTAAIGAQKRSKQSLSSLVSESRKTQLLDTLISSRGTLLVVPNTLTDHWEVSEDDCVIRDFPTLCFKIVQLNLTLFRNRFGYMLTFPLVQTNHH